MDVYFFKLKFHGFVLFGPSYSGGKSTSVVESDTLFSAILNVIKIYYGKKEADRLIEEFLKSPPFLISSLFPYWESKYYLPKPLYDDFISDELKKKLGKELKKRTLLNAQDFLMWLRGDQKYFEQRIESQDFTKEKPSIIKNTLFPKVTVDRQTAETNLFHVKYGKFKENSGLYGFVRFKNSEYIDKFRRYLLLLGKTGLGGERNTGFGQYEILEYAPINGLLKEIFDYKNSVPHVTLSLVYPKPEEVENHSRYFIAYDLIRKGGFITSGKNHIPIKKKSVTFLKEGSSFREPIEGMLVDVTPPNSSLYIDHRVYKYGYSFLIPL